MENIDLFTENIFSAQYMDVGMHFSTYSITI